MFVALTRPPGSLFSPPCASPDLFGLTEATSNDGPSPGVWPHKTASPAHRLTMTHRSEVFRFIRSPLQQIAWLALEFAAQRFQCRKANRSEEHTSELQSHVNLVCRLLLEKKK